MRPDEGALGLDLLDRQVVDRNGTNCGKVDDLEMDADEEGRPQVVAILIGTSAWPERLGGLLGLLVRAWVRLLPSRGGPARVPFGDVTDVSAAVVLAHDRSHYGLDRPDVRLRRLLVVHHRGRA